MSEHFWFDSVMSLPVTPEEMLLRAIFGDGPWYRTIENGPELEVIPHNSPHFWRVLSCRGSDEDDYGLYGMALALPLNWCCLRANWRDVPSDKDPG